MLVSDPSRNRASQLRRERRGSNARAAISTTGSASSRASDAVGHGLGGVLQQGPFPSPRQAPREHRPSQREPNGGDPNASFHTSLQSLPAALDHACAPLNLHSSLAHHPRLHGPLHEVRQVRSPPRRHSRVAQEHATRHGDYWSLQGGRDYSF